jgi:FkbM family methyltransferase
MNDPIPEGLLRTPQGIYVLKDDDHMSRWVEKNERLDIAEQEIDKFKRFIPVGGTVIDAGACIGDHTLTYAKIVGPTGMVLAFEPHPLSFKALALNFAPWRNVICFNKALSSTDWPSWFQLQKNAGESYVDSEIEDGGIQVETDILDDYLHCLSRCDLIHLDVEGLELLVLYGASEIIKKFHPFLVIEINHRCLARNELTEKNVRPAIEGLGYEWNELEPGHGTHLSQRDILATPKK